MAVTTALHPDAEQICFQRHREPRTTIVLQVIEITAVVVVVPFFGFASNIDAYAQSALQLDRLCVISANGDLAECCASRDGVAGGLNPGNAVGLQYPARKAIAYRCDVAVVTATRLNITN